MTFLWWVVFSTFSVLHLFVCLRTRCKSIRVFAALNSAKKIVVYCKYCYIFLYIYSRIKLYCVLFYCIFNVVKLNFRRNIVIYCKYCRKYCCTYCYIFLYIYSRIKLCTLFVIYLSYCWHTAQPTLYIFLVIAICSYSLYLDSAEILFYIVNIIVNIVVTTKSVPGIKSRFEMYFTWINWSLLQHLLRYFGSQWLTTIQR